MPTLVISVSGARGIVGDGLDEGIAYRLARAFAATVGPGKVLIGRDSRHSGPAFARAAAAGLTRSGCEVEDLGIVATPTAQVAVEMGEVCGGIIITASHNPSEWNALKFVGPDGTFLDAATMERLLADYHPRAEEVDPGTRDERIGASVETDAGRLAIAEHVRKILRAVDQDRIRQRGLKVVVDAVHGAGAPLLEPLLAELGVTTVWIDKEPNGNLPAHPEPRPERLAPLLAMVQREKADLGFAVDPDADRCALVTPRVILGEEWTLPLAALTRLREGARGPLVTNLSTSARIDALAHRFGVAIHRTPVGEAHVVGKMLAVNALIGGEGNGGVIDPRVHLGRDSGVAIALLLQLESTGGVDAATAEFPPRAMLKRKYAIPTSRRPDLMARLRKELGPPDSEEDGLRWVRGESWLHVRPSGTEPVVRAMAEAGTQGEAEALIATAAETAQALEG